MANDKPVTIPALGRQGFSLGRLYDLSTHQIFIRALWDEEELKDEKLTIQEHGTSDFKVEISNSQEDRFNALDVEASMKLEIGSGAVSVEGSAKYLNSSNSNSQVSSVSYTSKKVTKTKSLNQSHLAQGNVTYRDTLKEEGERKNATHVISSITYGKNAHFKFESRITDEEDKDQIAGRLKIAISAIKAEGEGEFKREGKDKKLDEETSCRFFGDYSGIVPPLNLEQARATILAIEKDETNPLGVPITVTLTPLSSLTSAEMKIVAELSAGAVTEAARLIQDIEDIQVILKTLEKSQASTEYYKYQTTIALVANSYRNQGTWLKSELCKILPKIKGNGEDEQELMKLIRDYDGSPFSKAKTMEWLKTLEDEVIFVDGLIKLAKERQIPLATAKSKFEGEKLEAMTGLFFYEAKFLSCLKLTGEENNGEVSLRPGSVLDDDEFRRKFLRHWGNFRTTISDAGLENSDSKVKNLFYLEFMAEENHCDIKLYERGDEVLSEINTNAQVGSVKYEPLYNTVTGVIKPRYGRIAETCQVAKEGGFIKLQLRYTEDQAEVDQSDAEDKKWENREFEHPAEKTSFQLNLGLYHGLHEGKDYIAQLRYQLSEAPGLASQWEQFQFKARERPDIMLSAVHIVDVNKPDSITCKVIKGHPHPSISWTRKGMDSIIAEGPTLEFEDPLAENQGTYIVQVDNGVGDAVKQELKIDVRGEISENGLKFDEDKYAICGHLKKGVTGEETIQLEFKLVDEEEEDKGWKQEEFTVPAKDTSFEFSLQKLRGIEEGKEYAVRIRYFQSSTVFGEWAPSKTRASLHFKARERPVISKFSSLIVMEVGVADKIDCVIEKGYPAPTIQWRKKGEDEIISDTPSLMFANPTKMDQATYHVKVENAVGSAEQEVLVKVTDTFAEKEEKLEELFERKMDKRLKMELDKIKLKDGELESELKRLDTMVRDHSNSIAKLSITESFVAYKEAWTEPNSIITWDSHPVNIGAASKSWNAGEWKSGQKGIYLVSWSFHSGLTAGHTNFLHLMRNGKAVPESSHWTVSRAGSGDWWTGSAWEQGGRTLLLSLNCGDTLHLKTGTWQGRGHHVAFCIHLLRAT